MKEFTEERLREIMSVLRNPWGRSDEQMMKARHDAADYIESGLTQRAADLVCTCRETYIAGVGKVVNATGCAKHQPSR